MIATTNLTQNLDPAFERRFLYKICFEKPDVEVRKKIWETMIPSLSDQEYSLLRLSVLYSYCNAEKLDNTVRRRIGF